MGRAEEQSEAAGIGDAPDDTVRKSSDFGLEADTWVLEGGRPFRGSVYERLHGGEIDGAIRNLRDTTAAFERKKADMDGRSFASIADISEDKVTVATYGDTFGEAYTLRSVEEGEVPEDVRQLFDDSVLDGLPFRSQEFYDLVLVEDHAHNYSVEGLTDSDIEEAQRAVREVEEAVENGEYRDRAFGYSSGFFL